ncbi:MAG: hypothetical protein HRT88_21370 [Lentisphaeraceae bacterium]|nr:hypothetical protein [Lentisphaeraceae bacterium]
MRLIICLSFSLLLSSCAIKMSNDSFQKEADQIARSSSFHSIFKSSVHYKGSDENYHYFHLSPKNAIPYPVKIDIKELEIDSLDIKKYSNNRDDWVDYALIR